MMTSARARPRKQHVSRILEAIGAGGRVSAQPSLVMTIGLPGSGKSTFARRLARATGAVVLESDALRRILFEHPDHGSDESKALFSAIHEVARLKLAAGKTVILDATNLRREGRLPAYAIASETGARLVLLHFSAPEQVILERLARRAAATDPDDRSTAGIAVYRQMAEAAQPVLEEHWHIDTSDAEATESALTRLIEQLGPAATIEHGLATGGSTP
jgi:predicted kinase